MKMAALLLVVLLVAAVARAFPDGAPSKAHYNPGDIVTVTVTTSGPSFKGFIVQGFNPQTREAATLNWKAPLNSGPVMFRATVVKSFTEFYANLLSQSAGY
ncbi:hypothetical protein MRX96_040892 [Rhipicephalus microplus]